MLAGALGACKGLSRIAVLPIASVCVLALGLAPAPAGANLLSASSWTDKYSEQSSIFENAMAFDPQYGIVIFGGFQYVPPCQLGSGQINMCPWNETRIWNGTKWTELPYTNAPLGSRVAPAMAYDAKTNQLIEFGGEQFGAGGGGFGALGPFVNESTLLFTGSGWRELSPSVSPPGRSKAAMAYDAATQQLILVGGFGVEHETHFNDTWDWTGANWVQLHPTTAPQAEYDASLAYYPGVGLVLFGGENSYNGNGSELGQAGTNATYVWNGTNWTKLSPPVSPSPRYGAAMAYDPEIGQLVLFGGNHSTKASETWTFDGTTWTLQSPSAAPADTTFSNLAYDSTSDELVLFGGITAESEFAKTTTAPQAVFKATATLGEPTITGVQAANEQLTVSFTAPTVDGGSPITGYEVRVNDFQEREFQLAKDTTSPITVTGLSNGDTDTVEVRAINAHGPGPWAKAPGTYSPHAESPEAPVISTARSVEFVSETRPHQRITSLGAKVAFRAPASDGGSPITGYQVECVAYNTACPHEYYGPLLKSPAEISGLTEGEEYGFRVRAQNAEGYGPWSNESNYIVAGVPPDAPEFVNATPSAGEATVSFQEPVTGKPGATYKIVATNELSFAETEVSGSGSPIVVHDLTNGEPYEVTVYACNAVAEAEPAGCPKTTIYDVVPGERPGAPTALHAAAGHGHGEQATLAFKEPSNLGVPGSDLYYVVACEVHNPTYCEEEVVSEDDSDFGFREVTVPYLTNGVEYELSVYAENASGRGQVSGPSNIVIPGLEPTIVPGATKEVTDDSATVNFTVNPNDVALEYCNVYYGPLGSGDPEEAPCSETPGAGSTPVHVTAHLTGLAAEEYEYFIDAGSEDTGTTGVFGHTFTTLANSAVETTTNPSEPATATDTAGTLTAVASKGTGTVGAGQYAGLPSSVTEQLTFRAGAYFDVFISEGNSFEEVRFTDCELYGAKTVRWYNPITGTWPKVSNEVLDAGPPACITVTINETTEPDLKQMEGTVFAATVTEGETPTVAKLSTNKGSTAGGTPVTITGTNFAGVTDVKFGSTKATKITYDSPTTITVLSPPEPAGKVEITVVTPDGTSPIKAAFRRVAQFKYQAPRK